MTRALRRIPWWLAPALLGPIVATPWLWQLDRDPAAVAGHIAFVIGFGPLTLLSGVLRPAAFVCALGGLWLAVSPWVLGYAGGSTEALLSDLLTGSSLVLVCGIRAAAADGGPFGEGDL